MIRSKTTTKKRYKIGFRFREIFADDVDDFGGKKRNFSPKKKEFFKKDF